MYELTPEGISLEKDGEAVRSSAHVAGRRMDFIVISLLCAGLILFAYDKWWTEPQTDNAIAVLNGDLSPQEAADNLQNGLAEWFEPAQMCGE